MSQREELNAVADRCEREEPSLELDCAIASAIDFYRSNPNLDTLRYTTSLDAHVRPLGDDVFWRSGHDGTGPDPSLFKAEVLVCREDLTGSYFGLARTEAMARRAAELRARAALVTP